MTAYRRSDDMEALEALTAVVLDLYRKDPKKAMETLSKSPPEIMGAAAMILSTCADEMGHAAGILANLANPAPPGHGYKRLRVV